MTSGKNGYCYKAETQINYVAQDADDLIQWIEGIKKTKVLTFANLEIFEDIIKHMENALDLVSMAMDDHIAEMDDGS